MIGNEKIQRIKIDLIKNISDAYHVEITFDHYSPTVKKIHKCEGFG